MAHPDPRQAAAAIVPPDHARAGFHRRRIAAVLDRLEVRARELGRPLRVVELLSGEGLLTCAAALVGHRSLGLDPRAEAVHRAKLFAQEKRCDGLFWHSDLVQDPFWEQTVGETLGGKPDFVVMADALRAIHQVEFFVERLNRWVESGKHLLVAERNPKALLGRADDRARTFDAWRQLLEARGFDVESPSGVDDLAWLERLAPSRCSSLVFTARRR